MDSQVMLATKVFKRVIVCIAVGLLAAGPASAVQLSQLVGSNMVLQRDSKVVIWGWADPGETLQVDFRGRHVTAKANREGRWSISLGPFKAGGPYEMGITGKNRILLHNILIGDVWLASGQSNMEFPLKTADWSVNNADTEIAGAKFPLIRLFKVHHTVALKPQMDVDAEAWTDVTPATVGSFSAVAYLFGRELYQRYQVPIGLIESDWSGTVAEDWISESSLKRVPELRQSLESLKLRDEQATTAEYDQYLKQKAEWYGDHTAEYLSTGSWPAFATPQAMANFGYDPTAGLLFNGMIAPVTPYRIKGVIWYQGESNAIENRSTQYRVLFPALIEDWRRQWGYDVPFVFVQLAGYGPNRSEPAEYSWADLRDAQSSTLSLPHTGMATAVDIGDEKEIHPRNKQELAHRMVLVAAKVVYGENIVYSGPVYKSMLIERDRIRIRFSSVGSGLLVKDKYGYARGFEIAGADGKYAWAQARRDGHDVLVFNESIREPVSVRYDWCNTPDGNLYNAEGLPAIPFRTDTSRELNVSR